MSAFSDAGMKAADYEDRICDQFAEGDRIFFLQDEYEGEDNVNFDGPDCWHLGVVVEVDRDDEDVPWFVRFDCTCKHCEKFNAEQTYQRDAVWIRHEWARPLDDYVIHEEPSL